MSSALGDKKGRSANSSDLTRLRRKTAELAAYATYTGLSVNKKMNTQLGTTAGVLANKTAAITTIDAATTRVGINPITRAAAAAHGVPVTSRYIPTYY
jgi:Zn-dependent oligopeptidase